MARVIHDFRSLLALHVLKQADGFSCILPISSFCYTLILQLDSGIGRVVAILYQMPPIERDDKAAIIFRYKELLKLDILFFNIPSDIEIQCVIFNRNAVWGVAINSPAIWQ